jgi:hypothetical protein
LRMSSKGPRYVVLRNQNKRSAVEYWARVLPPWESANRRGFTGNHSADRKMA